MILTRRIGILLVLSSINLEELTLLEEILVLSSRYEIRMPGTLTSEINRLVID